MRRSAIPQTRLKDVDMFWDFLSQNPETVHQVLILFSDRGTPDGYYLQHGYSGHTYKYINASGDFHYVQIYVRSDRGFKTLTAAQAGELSGSNPDYGIQQLFETIEKGEYPSWTVYVQTMTPAQAESFRYNILDMTKAWPHKEYPLRQVGKIVLNENVQNYFAEIEQIAFSPSHLIPGIEPSMDPMLQSRLFSYPDAHRYRLGVNYQQLPINVPIVPVVNFQRDCQAMYVSQGSRPNYKSSIQPLKYKNSYVNVKHETFLGHAHTDLSEPTELDFEQPRELYNRVFDANARQSLINNISDSIKNVKSKEIIARQRTYPRFILGE